MLSPFPSMNPPIVLEPARKRRRNDNPQTLECFPGSMNGKPLRGRRGKLSRLPDLPLDVLFEIFGYLRPLDLLRLARSWKGMRAFLMNPSSKWIWKRTFSCVEGLPVCPSDMSEPQYANLLFSPHCHYCGTEPVPSIIWVTRSRACKKCFPKHFQQAKHFLDDPKFFSLPEECWKFSQVTGKIIHCTSFTPVTSRDTCRQIVSLDLIQEMSEVHAILKERPSDLESWLTKTRLDHEAWTDTATALAQWQRDQVKKRSLELDAARQRRLDGVIRNLSAAGWGDDLGKMDLDLIRQHELVKVPRDLTDRVWTNMKPKMIDFMERVTTSLREEHRLAQIAKRRRLFSQHVTRCHRHYAAIPAPISELSQIEPIRSIIEDSPVDQIITVDDFPPPPIMFELFCGWHKLKKQALVRIMQQSRLVPSRPTTYHINLATTFFYCEGAGPGEPIGQQDILVHPATFSWRPGYQYPSVALKRLFSDFQQEFWNFGNDRIFLHRPAFLAARAIVGACGYNPELATAASMDSRFPLLECVSCRGFTASRLVMTWRRAVVHAVDHPAQPRPPKWRALDPSDPYYSIAFDRIVGEAPSFRCPLCHILGSATLVTAHLKQRHTLCQTVTLMRQPHSAVRVGRDVLV